jgi:ribonucleoside-diphosphate reductase alpha chain
MSEGMSKFAETIFLQKYSHTLRSGRQETWNECAARVVKNVLGAADFTAEDVEYRAAYEAIRDRKFIPGGRYLYASGRPLHQTQNCLLMRAQDSRQGWAELMHKAGMGLMTGAGIGANYSLIRPNGTPIRKTGGTASGPIALMEVIDNIGHNVKQGGSRRSAIWAGLNWRHADIFRFIHLKDWSKPIRAMKAQDFNFKAPMDGTNISVCLDDEFFHAYNHEKNKLHAHAHAVYWEVVRQMLKTSEPGFSVDVGENAGEDLRNACTEITSPDDSDICNIGSLNLARINSLKEMEEVTNVAVMFLLCGTLYSDVPYEKVAQVRDKNRRLGLGIMGIHEWLLTHGKRYAKDDDLASYLQLYSQATGIAGRIADEWSISRPVKTRAIAPTGTIGIIAETTTGVEPIFCTAYKRRYLKHETWNYQYVVDPTAKKLLDAGIEEDQIEDAYTLAQDVERRVAFQAWVQGFVDHGISSTINLPAWGTELNNEGTVRGFGEMLLKYLPRLRGITCYPDGARGGQPLTPVKLGTAMKHLGEVVMESADVCDITKGESCGA